MLRIAERENVEKEIYRKGRLLWAYRKVWKCKFESDLVTGNGFSGARRYSIAFTISAGQQYLASNYTQVSGSRERERTKKKQENGTLTHTNTNHKHFLRNLHMLVENPKSVTFGKLQAKLITHGYKNALASKTWSNVGKMLYGFYSLFLRHTIVSPQYFYLQVCVRVWVSLSVSPFNL